MSVPYKLYNGDCVPVLADLPSSKIAIISDPPYGISHRRGMAGNRGKGITLGAGGIIGDNKPFDPSHLLRFDEVVLWGANWYSDKLPAGRWLIWDKQEHGGSGDFSEAETAWCKNGHAVKIFRHMWLGVQRASEVGQARLHPTQKPVALFRWIFKLLEIPFDVVIVDPYMGSGSCGVAAIESGYKFIGCEIEQKYFSIAESRVKSAALQPALFPRSPTKRAADGGNAAAQNELFK